MKKVTVVIMLTLALSFGVFLIGYYLGRQQDNTPIQINSNTSQAGVQQTTRPVQPNPTGSTPLGSTGTATVPQPSSTAPLFPLNLNTATKEQLEQLPGIGPKLAQAILDYRAKYGPFQSKSDLMRVPGIGEKKLEAVKDLIYVDYISGGTNEDSSCG
jgi:competence ComEA-like helix-hairpin-helix protein